MARRKNAQLSDFIKELDAIEDDRLELVEARKEVVKRAQIAGYAPVMVRKVFARHRRTRQEVLEEDAAIQALEEELGLSPNVVKMDPTG